MHFLYTLLLIFIQIVGESLPISSSSHTYLFTYLTNSAQLPELLDHFLHGPTLLILTIFFRKHLATLCKFFTATASSQKRIFSLFSKIMLFTCTTTIITTAGYFSLKTYTLSTILNNHRTPLTIGGLCVTVILLFVSHYFENRKPKSLEFTDAFILGSTQMLAQLPGISRFASTFVIASLRGYSWKQAFRISFLIEVPLLILAFFIHGIPEFLQPQNLHFFIAPLTLLTLFIATGLGYFALHASWKMASNGHLWKFSWYLIIPITLFLLF